MYLKKHFFTPMFFITLSLLTLLTSLLVMSFKVFKNSIRINSPVTNREFRKSTVPHSYVLVSTFVLPLVYYFYIYSNKRSKLDKKMQLDTNFVVIILGHFLNSFCSLSLIHCLKLIILRKRPCFDNCGKGKHQNDPWLFESFPSGHTALMFTFLPYLMFFNYKMKIKFSNQILVFILTFLTSVWVAFTRYLDCKHHPSDIIGGVVISILVALVDKIGRAHV